MRAKCPETSKAGVPSAYKTILQIYTYLTTLHISKFIRDLIKNILASLCSDNELYLRTVHLRTMMPVLAVMLLTNKAIQKRHSAAQI